LALYALHLLEGLIERRGSLLQARKYPIVFLFVELVARLALFGWVDHHLDKTLCHHGRAESDRYELVDLLNHLGIEAAELKVSSSVAAFADHALRNAMQRSKLNILILLRIGLLHLPQHSLETMELPNEDVGLVDLVRQDN
jgi:hypothetical protein